MSVPLKKRHGMWKHSTQKSGVKPSMQGESSSGEGILLKNSRKNGSTFRDCDSVPYRAIRGYQTLDSSEMNSLQLAKHDIPLTYKNHRDFLSRHTTAAGGDLTLNPIIATNDAERGQQIRERRQHQEMEGHRRMTNGWVNLKNQPSSSNKVESSSSAGTSDEIYLHINGRKYIARPVETQELEGNGSSGPLTSNCGSTQPDHLVLPFTSGNSTEHLNRPFVTSNSTNSASDILSEPAEPLKYFLPKDSESFEQMILKDKLSVLSHLQQVQSNAAPGLMVGSEDSLGDDVWKYEDPSASRSIILKQPCVEESLGISTSRCVAPHSSQLSICHRTRKSHSLPSSHARNIPTRNDQLFNSNSTCTQESHGTMDDSLSSFSSISPSPPSHSLPMSPGSMDTSVPNSVRSVSNSGTDSPDIQSSNRGESDEQIFSQSALLSDGSYKDCGDSPSCRTLTTLDSGVVMNPPLKIEDNGNGTELPTVTRPKDNKCPVCGDEISGYHYGIYSCESCKGFFKRTVQSKRNERLRCARSGNCEMNLRSRKHCAACRFQKCINQGMKLEAIRGDRQRGGRSMYEGSSEYRRRQMLQNQQQSSTVSPNVKKRKRRKSVCGGVQKTDAWQNQAEIREEPKDKVSTLNIMKSTEDYLASTLVGELIAHNEILSAQPLASCCQMNGKSEEAIISSVCHLINHHLLILYEWTQGLPFFRELETVDQEFLYKHRWTHLMLSHYILTSPNDPAVVPLRDGRLVDLEQCFESATFFELMKRLRDIYRYFKNLCLDATECALLKLLVLLNSDLLGISQPSRVCHFQETVQDMLFQYVLSKDPTNFRRVGDILLKFAEIEKMCLIVYEHLMYKFMAGHLSEFVRLSEVLKNT